MRDFMLMLLSCSVTMSVLALAYLAVIPLLAKRYSPRGLYDAWLIMVIGFIIPWRPHLADPLIKVLPADTPPPVLPIAGGAPLAAPLANPLPPSASPALTIWQIAAAIWLTGMLAFLAYHVVKHSRFMRMTKRWSERITDEKTLVILQNTKADLGLAKEIGLYQCASIGTPMLVGFCRPKILLPDTLLSADELPFILRHELIHYKHRDLWSKVLVLMAAAIHWFNPLLRLITRAIDIQGELACDAEVVNQADHAARQHYCAAILAVVRCQSHRKTALSTNFYGGKLGMKKRLFTIVDTRRKKIGAVLVCSISLLTLGTGLAFAAVPAEAAWPEYIHENIVILPHFVPDPDLYAPYAAYGLTLSADGQKLLYQGQAVRTFVDEAVPAWAFYYEAAGRVDLAVTRNDSGKITGIADLSTADAQKYYDAFFAEDTQGAIHTEGTKYDQYAPFGITLTAEEDRLTYNGQRVRLLVDENGGYLYTFWVDDAGTADLSVVRDASGQITQIAPLSQDKAQAYLASANDDKALEAALEAKVTQRLQKLYPEQ